MVYIERDWGPRSETGETDTPEVVATDYGGFIDEEGNQKSRLILVEDIGFEDWEEDEGDDESVWYDSHWKQQYDFWLSLALGVGSLAPARTAEEQARVELLEEKLEPYISQLRWDQKELLYRYHGDRNTYEEMAEEDGLANRGGAFKRVESAERALLTLIAKDNPRYEEPTDRRRKVPQEKLEEYAWEVIETWLT